MTRRTGASLIAIFAITVAGIASGCDTADNEPAGTLGTPTPAPSEAAPSEAAPSEAAPSEEAPEGGVYAVGDRIKLGDEEYFGILEVDLDVPPGDFLEPDAGNKWIAVLAEVEGINPDGATYNPLYFKVKDGDGFEYTPLLAFGKEPVLKSSNDLPPGQKAKGWVTFEVPEVAQGLVLSYVPGLFGDSVQVALQ